MCMTIVSNVLDALVVVIRASDRAARAEITAGG
jgi:hypothetical protein